MADSPRFYRCSCGNCTWEGVGPFDPCSSCDESPTDGESFVSFVFRKDAQIDELQARIAELEAAQEWRPVDEAIVNGRTYLTMHWRDLYPVVAYCLNGIWRRETEGPEDSCLPPSRHEVLLRPPTHYRDCPFAPQQPQIGGDL